MFCDLQQEGEEVPVEQTVRNVDIKFDYETGALSLVAQMSTPQF